MIEVCLKTLCMTTEDALKTSQELDRAAKCLGGYREQVLDYASGWDNWYFPKNKFHLLTLFVTYSKMLLETRCEDARYSYKTKGNHPRKLNA